MCRLTFIKMWTISWCFTPQFEQMKVSTVLIIDRNCKLGLISCLSTLLRSKHTFIRQSYNLYEMARLKLFQRHIVLSSQIQNVNWISPSWNSKWSRTETPIRAYLIKFGINSDCKTKLRTVYHWLRFKGIISTVSYLAQRQSECLHKKTRSVFIWRLVSN